MTSADVPWIEQGSIPDHRTTLQYMENPTGRGVIPQWDVQADWRDEVRPPPSILLDFMYGAAVVKHWKCDRLDDMLEKRFKDDFKKILDEKLKRSTPEDDAPAVESDDSNDPKDPSWKPSSGQKGRKTFSSDASAGLLGAMDDVVLLSMLLKGTTPRTMAAEWKKRNEEEELSSQEHSHEKVQQWLNSNTSVSTIIILSEELMTRVLTGTHFKFSVTGCSTLMVPSLTAFGQSCAPWRAWW